MSDWTNNPKLSGIDSSKLAMLQALASQGGQKSQSEMLPFLMAVANSSKKKGVQFTPEEMSVIFDVIKESSSPEEAAKIDQMINVMRMMKK
ncbi:hypothetical protein INP51_06745 [Blautia liquoris]|uniref:Uncharacterized protein n=1 Tax=Blautia liquoris TaxID=2779518 RepID=A0A7M2RJW7_9FIRM|nr:hypothetical protein [Blautia liquoris]QOV20626.1 hypothetical protein INP51_06745 [Blautia liquoris]